MLVRVYGDAAWERLAAHFPGHSPQTLEAAWEHDGAEAQAAYGAGRTLASNSSRSAGGDAAPPFAPQDDARLHGGDLDLATHADDDAARALGQSTEAVLWRYLGLTTPHAPPVREAAPRKRKLGREGGGAAAAGAGAGDAAAASSSDSAAEDNDGDDGDDGEG